ncbi:DUF3050 domain-containing protein [soil metagenome]
MNLPVLTRIEQIRIRLAPLRAALLEHPVYREIDGMPSLRTFMEHHVFAVWDFMSLLKELQRRLCCVEVPWRPAHDPTNCRLINEIVLAEESDEDGQGGFISHFEMYRQAMIGCGADTSAVDRLINSLQAGRTVELALADAVAPECARQFVRHTFAVIDAGDVCALASAFTFGREDLLPDVFQRIVDELNVSAQGGLDAFKYYLERHIGLDGDEHGPMATRLVASLCGDDDGKWSAAEQAAVECLLERRKLWDGIYESICDRKSCT